MRFFFFLLLVIGSIANYELTKKEEVGEPIQLHNDDAKLASAVIKFSEV